MALANVNIIRTDGAISAPPTSQDGISGFISYGTEGAITVKLFTPKDALAYCSESSALYYHISEYFRYSSFPLYLKTSTTTPTTFTDVQTLKDYSNGEIRQVAVFNQLSNYSSSHITALQSVAEECEEEYAPLQVLYSANSTSGIAGLTDLKLLDCPRVSFIIGEDLSGRAATIRTATGKAVSCIGTALGIVSASSVSEDIGFVKKYNVVASEHTAVGFIDGTELTDTSKTLLDTLDTYHYVFLRKFVGSDGVYFNNGYTSADPASTDFSKISYNRAYDKAFRNLRTVLLPEVNAPLYVDSSGKLSGATIAHFKELGNQALQTLKDNGEISAYSIGIDANQKVLQTSKLEIVAKIIPVGIAHEIEVSLGFALSL